jgi:hypothetical protein
MENTRLLPVSGDDIGSFVRVSNDGEKWECLELARIITHEESEYSDRGIYRGLDVLTVYVCWVDHYDEDGKRTPTMNTKSFFRATKMKADQVSTPESAYELCHQRVKELESQFKKEKAYLTELEKVLVDDWILSGCDKKEVQVNGRRCSLTIDTKQNFYVKVGDRDVARKTVEKLGVDGMMKTDFDDAKLAEYLNERMVRNMEGPPEFPGVPKELTDLVKVHEWSVIKRRSLGARVPD